MYGMVKSVSSNKMVIWKVKRKKYTHKTVTIHFAPYTKIYLKGDSRLKISQIKKGDAVESAVLVGNPKYYIAEQFNDWGNINKAWDMKNKP